MERTDFLATMPAGQLLLEDSHHQIAMLVIYTEDQGLQQGRHDAGPVRDVTQTFTEAVGGRRVQRCDWCDKVVREYEVTVNEARQASIRRIY